MNLVLCVSITWLTLIVVFLGLGFIFLLAVEHASDTAQATMADERISDRALQLAKLDLAMSEAVQNMRESADACHVLAPFEDSVTLAPYEPVPTAAGAVGIGRKHTSAVIIRHPRFSRTRPLGDRGGGAEETGATTRGALQIGAIFKAMDVLSTEMSQLGTDVTTRADAMLASARDESRVT